MNQALIHNRLTTYQIVEAFGENIETIYREKYLEIIDELMPVYDHRDRIFNGPYSDEVKNLAISFTETLLTDRQKMLFKSIEHMRKVKKMRRFYGIGGRRSKEVGMAILPLEEARQIPFESIHQFEKIKRNRGGFVALCPFHVERTASFTVKANRYKCFGCGKYGDTIQFIMDLNGMTFVDAVKFLGKLNWKGGL